MFPVLLAAALLAATPALATPVTYKLEVINSWSSDEERDGEPGADFFPEDAHFSFLGGATHGAGADFWSTGLATTPAMTEMAEFGRTGPLADATVDAGTGDPAPLVWDVQDAIGQGAADKALEWRHWFCAEETVDSRCGETTVFFDIEESFPLVTLVSMIGPSPDWFIGVDGLALRDEAGWIERLTVDLVTYDGGTRTGEELVMRGTGAEDGVVTEIVDPDDPRLGDPSAFVSTGQDIGGASPGRFVFTLQTASVPVPASAPLLLAALGGLAALLRRSGR